MMRHLRPVAIFPEKTRPKAQKRPLSEVGTILEMYIMRGPLGLQVFMAMAASSSLGPSYNISVLYFWAVTGEGKWIQIIMNMASPAGSQVLMTHFISGLPSICSSSWESLTSSFCKSPGITSFLKFMMESRMYMLKARLLSSSLVLAHFLVLGLK